MLKIFSKIKKNKGLKKIKTESFKLGYKKFFKELYENKKYFYFFVFGIAYMSFADAMFPYLTGKIVNSIVNLTKINIFDSNIYFVFILILILLIFQFSSNIFDTIFAKNFIENIKNNIYMKYKKRYFKIISKYPVSFFKTESLGKITYLSSSGATNLSLTITLTLNIFNNLGFLIFSYFFVFFISYKMFFLILFFSLFYILYFYLTFPTRVKVQKELNSMRSDISSLITEKINFLIEIKRFNKEKYENERIKKTFNLDYQDKFNKKIKFDVNNSLFSVCLFQLMRAVVFLFIFYLFLNSEINAGEVIALSMYAAWIVRTYIFSLNSISAYVDAFIVVGDSEKILKNRKERYSKNKIKISKIDGEIEFKDIFFQYEDGDKSSIDYRKNKISKQKNNYLRKKDFSLNNIDFKIKKGQKVAFVGESGGGKTTAVDLIGSFLYPQKGEVLIDGISTKKINLNSLRKNIAYVSQDVSIFNTSIEENIKYGSFKKKVSESEMREAAKDANIDEFISNLKDGYKTSVGEKGLKLSGGQKQRISIARAVLKKPKILILDEPTSALDIESERKVTESLEKLMKDKTTIIIAHRLSTIKNVDKIFVFKDGKIIESGNYKELLKNKNTFYNMVKMHLEFTKI